MWRGDAPAAMLGGLLAEAGQASVALATTPQRTFVLSDAEVGYLVLGAIFLAIGLITLLLTVLHAASRDASVFLFGTMSCLWGLRFLLYTRLVPEVLTGRADSLQHLARSLAYLGGAAAFAFARAYLGRGWRSTLDDLARLSLAFAVVASLVLCVDADRDRLLPAFNVLVLVGALVVVGNLLHPSQRRQPGRRGIIVGLCASTAFFSLENLRALGLVPLPWDVEWIGVVILYVTLGRLIAVRIFTNERRLAAISQELETARRIQTSLLPDRAPPVAGLGIAARYLPMNEVAGDIYDFAPLGEGRLGILVADVSGHGVPAALIASLVKGAFRARIDDLERPERVLAGMNRILTGQLGREFVTASCTFVDAAAGILRHASAGHPPLLVQPRDADRCLSLERSGLILGQFADADYTSIERPLAARDRLLLYTDGLVEATDPRGEDYGEPALREFLARHRRLAAAEFADALLVEVRTWTGGTTRRSLADDLTVVVVDVAAR